MDLLYFDQQNKIINIGRLIEKPVNLMCLGNNSYLNTGGL